MLNLLSMQCTSLPQVHFLYVQIVILLAFKAAGEGLGWSECFTLVGIKNVIILWVYCGLNMVGTVVKTMAAGRRRVGLEIRLCHSLLSINFIIRLR